MSRYPAPTREHHDDFCTVERWTLVRGATGKPVSHHRTYELTLWDHRILRTRISQPVDGSTYGPAVWSHILRTQLETTAETFWACVQNGILPDRGAPGVREVPEALPLHLYRELQRLGVEDAEIAALTPAAAADLLAARYLER